MRDPANIAQLALAKWSEMKTGARVITNDEELDYLIQHFAHIENEDSHRYYRHLASIMNPQRVGILDQYVAWLDDTEAPCPPKPSIPACGATSRSSGSTT